jgi:CRISPR-associated protein Csx17
MPERALGWLDAAIVLTADGAAFPPLLGTGGNDGRLEFSNNFMQRLVDAVIEPSVSSPIWLAAALFDREQVRLVDAAIGQFDPAAAGGANSSESGSAASRVNPWDYVLMIEGAVWLASSVARRLGADLRGRAAMPFTVSRAEAGQGGDSGAEDVRGEFFAPLWEHPTTAVELSRLVAEGRAEWRGRQSRTGLDFVRAAATLGVDRGIERFQRFTFSNRFGRTFVAVPTNEVRTAHRQDVPVLGELDPWVDSVRRLKNPPASVVSSLRRLERAQFAATAETTQPQQRFLDVLAAAANVESALAVSNNGRENVRPIPQLSASWIDVADDSSPEFRIARSIASSHDVRMSQGGPTQSSLAGWLRHVSPTRSGRWEWDDQSPASRRLGNGTLSARLGSIIERRIQDSSVANDGDAEQLAAFDRGSSVDLNDLALLLNGSLDLGRLDAIVRALSLVDPTAPQQNRRSPGPRLAIPPVLAVTQPFFAPHPMHVDSEDGIRKVALRPQAGWGRLIATGKFDALSAQCLQRLRVHGLTPAIRSIAVLPNSMAATLPLALICRVSASATGHLLSTILTNPNTFMEKHNG